jgi:hypothetical protein
VAASGLSSAGAAAEAADAMAEDSAPSIAATAYETFDVIPQTMIELDYVRKTLAKPQLSHFQFAMHVREIRQDRYAVIHVARVGQEVRASGIPPRLVPRQRWRPRDRS